MPKCFVDLHMSKVLSNEENLLNDIPAKLIELVKIYINLCVTYWMILGSLCVVETICYRGGSFSDTCMHLFWRQGQ